MQDYTTIGELIDQLEGLGGYWVRDERGHERLERVSGIKIIGTGHTMRLIQSLKDAFPQIIQHDGSLRPSALRDIADRFSKAANMLLPDATSLPIDDFIRGVFGCIDEIRAGYEG